MKRSFSRRGSSFEPLIERISHAAGELNPYLIVLAIGLAVLNATCLIVRAPHFALVRCPSDSSAAPRRAGDIPAPVLSPALRAGT